MKQWHLELPIFLDKLVYFLLTSSHQINFHEEAKVNSAEISLFELTMERNRFLRN